MDKYFAKFPLVEYNDYLVRDISRVVALNNDVSKTPALFYPYEVQPGMRADLVAHAYYEDSYLDWLLYLTNGITDPYYDWYLSENDFNEFIIKKYGSAENAMEKIKFYRVTWDDEDEITVSFYNNNLPNVLKKYWVPNYGRNTQILSYTRRTEDWIVNTNQVLNLVIDGLDGTFIDDERVRTSSNGQGFVVTSNSSLVTIQHIEGTIQATDTLTGNSSGATCTITDVDIVTQNIELDEYVYWSPVTCWDYEQELNESKKHIYVLDGNHRYETSRQLKERLKDDV